MIAILIAILLAALAYWLCLAIGLPAVVAVIAAVLVLVCGVTQYGRLQLLKSCTVCGAISEQARCPLHRRDENASWSKDRDRGNQARFRKALIRMYGMRCAAVVDGVRCPATTGLQAHHTQPGNDDPRTGALLCTEHHRAVDAHAR